MTRMTIPWICKWPHDVIRTSPPVRTRLDGEPPFEHGNSVTSSCLRSDVHKQTEKKNPLLNCKSQQRTSARSLQTLQMSLCRQRIMCTWALCRKWLRCRMKGGSVRSQGERRTMSRVALMCLGAPLSLIMILVTLLKWSPDTAGPWWRTSLQANEGINKSGPDELWRPPRIYPA